MFYHLRSRSYVRNLGIAIDNKDTKIREDCFCIERTKHSGIILKIMVVVPPFQKVMTGRLSEALATQLRTFSSKNLISIFNTSCKMMYGLQTDRQSEVLIAEYTLNERGTLVKETVYLGTTVLGKHVFYEDYSKTPDTNQYMEVLSKAIANKPQLLKVSKSYSLKKLRDEHGLGSEFVFMALELFNHTCRTFARVHKIPFVSPPHKGHKAGFQISEGYARFNHSLRNPCSFLNIANLVYFLSDKRLFLSSEELSQYLPKKENNPSR